MAKIAYILLCHKDPESIIRQAERLTASGDVMSIHFDGRSDDKAYGLIQGALRDNPNVTFTRRRLKCGWGEWSLVDATLLAINAALDVFVDATHFYMLSGDCMAIKSAEYVHSFLDDNDFDFIESYDFIESDWIKTGLKQERLIYRHYFNERQNKRLFYAAMEVQKRLGLTRNIPSDVQVMIGSQWWCLRRETVEAVVDFVANRTDVTRFFATTWIPDETFFQTIVRHLVPRDEIQNRTLTCLMFTDYGMPVTFYNDHYDLLVSQDFLFARKISPEALDLKRRLGLLYAAKGVKFDISTEALGLYKFLTERGRIGRRFAPRFWEAEATRGQERELLVVVCKKWHVAKRLLERVRQVTNIPSIEYLFSEEHTELPDLGGIQTTLSKRHRHRRALISMLFDYLETDRMIICLDPANLDLMQDFASENTMTRFLELQCQFTDDYLLGHAMRVGLAVDHTKQEAIDQLLPAIRLDIEFESKAIRSAGFQHTYRMRESATIDENGDAIAQFLSLTHDKGKEIAELEYLYAD